MKIERFGQIVLSITVFCCLIVVVSEFFVSAWIISQDFSSDQPMAYSGIAFCTLIGVFMIMLFGVLLVGRRMVVESILQTLLAVAEKVAGPQSAIVARLCVPLADCFTEEERFDEAEKLLKRAVKINAQPGRLACSAFSISTELRYLEFLRRSGRSQSAVGVMPYLLELEKCCRPQEFRGKQLYPLALLLVLLATAMLIVDWTATTATLAGNYGLARGICKLAPAPSAVLPQLEIGGSIEMLAGMYNKGSQWSKAEPLYKALLEIRSMQHGSNSAATAEVMQLLSEAYLNQGKYDKAQKLLQQALQIYADKSGPDDTRIGKILNDLATIYCEGDKFDQSRQLLRRALAIYEKNCSPGDPGVADSLHRLALVCANKGNYSQAAPLYKLALAVSEENYGANDARVATTLTDYAVFLKKTGHPDEARKIFARARTIRTLHSACAQRHESKVM